MRLISIIFDCMIREPSQNRPKTYNLVIVKMGENR